MESQPRVFFEAWLMYGRVAMQASLVDANPRVGLRHRSSAPWTGECQTTQGEGCKKGSLVVVVVV